MYESFYVEEDDACIIKTLSRFPITQFNTLQERVVNV